MTSSLGWYISLYFASLYMRTASVTITCTEKQFNEPPPEWIMPNEKTPSDILDLQVRLQQSEESQRSVLNISWTISPDGSIQELRATMICIQSPQTTCFRCDYSALFESAQNPQGQPWQFYYAEYPVKPATNYFVTAFNIPTANIGEYPPEKSTSLFTPSCSIATMKNHESCEDAQWNPNISLCMVNNDVVISFTASPNSLRYDVELVMCDLIVTPKLNGTTISKSNRSRISITFVRNDVLDLSEGYCATIRPYFPLCQHNCYVHEKVLNCSKKDDYKLPNTGESLRLFTGRPYLIHVFIVLSVTLLALGVGLYLLCKLGKVNERIVFTNEIRLQSVKVLIIYSMENALFQNVVLTFAEFLQSSTGIQVIIDMWQKINIAEVGTVQWLATQKENADKIIIVCSKGVKMKCDAICCKTNMNPNLNNSEDIFSTALNIFCSDIQNGSYLHKYIIVYFDQISSVKDIPSIFRPCVKYCLGKNINKFYRNLYDASQKPCGKCAILMPYCNYKIEYNQKMRKAILEFKNWQNSNALEITLEDLELLHENNF
ncbi:interleukin-17 receptor B isoform X1 [Chiloscyllium plagiosum]|uniref:interleukin-17 receptor B isoform X1 n=1 Tax=Chiloscyllium plagiosum TaxID=36176 RepID=UPI001CB7EDA8|nr:interleukin-17 receptor B isoform X1 [Chiloscyllium plagiosum]